MTSEDDFREISHQTLMNESEKGRRIAVDMMRRLQLGWLLFVFLIAEDHGTLAQEQQRRQQQQRVKFRDLAPPSFHTGSVIYSNTLDVDYWSLNLREFDAATAAMYLNSVSWKAPNATIDTGPWGKAVARLKANNIKVIHGHVLVYPNFNLDLPWWVSQPNNLVETRMYQYIDKLATARRGDIWVWDVVNEAMGNDYEVWMDQDGVRTIFPDGRPIKEYQAMGQSYIAKAFRRAKAKDPSALLLLTDYDCEEDDPSDDNEKSDRFFRFVNKLKLQKVPIDGVGMQFHVSSLPGEEPNYANIVRNFQRFRDAGFSIFITEMDVKSYNTTKPLKLGSKVLQQAAARQALVYSRVMKICLNEPACKCLLMWDDADYNSRNPTAIYSWLQPYQFANPLVYWYPSPFWDINSYNFSAKPAWYAMQASLLNATGVYRVTSARQSEPNYLKRNGTATTPSFQVGLYTLNNETNSWTSMKWRFERVDIGLYRIACKWGSTTGYLTRLGLPDPQTSVITPTSTVYVQELQTTWWSQEWYLEYLYDNQYKIASRWGSNGTLTRLGLPDQSGVIQPTNRVYLDAKNSWVSQIWRLERVWSDGDTKTATDAFWL